jgi:hypothetical protein
VSHEPAPAPSRAAEAVVNTAPEPLRWSSLVSADDAEYVRRLRKAGCPERTIRDILAAHIGHRYDEKREALEKQRQKSELGLVESKDAIAKLWDEQNDLIARLFGTQNSFGADGAVAHTTSSTGPSETLTAAGTIRRVRPKNLLDTAPVVFYDPDPSWGLNEQQLQMWDQVYQDFATAVGTSQNPTDPAYRERWQTAQVVADRQLMTFFGAKVTNWQAQLRSRMPPAPSH